MSELFCHANCVFQSGGRCGFKYSTACGMPSCRSNACVHYIPALRGQRRYDLASTRSASPTFCTSRQLQAVRTSKTVPMLLWNDALREAEPPHLAEPLRQIVHVP